MGLISRVSSRTYRKPEMSSSSTNSSHHQNLCAKSSSTRSLLIEPSSPGFIKNRIEILENCNELGSGSCSSTHLAVHRETNTNLAVKLSDHSSRADLRFKEEVKILKYIKQQLSRAGDNQKSRIISNSLVEFKGYDTDKYQNLLVLEYCDSDLQKKLNTEIKMEEKEVKKMVTQLASCLDFLHKIGVVHRDIKPSNILLKNEKNNNNNNQAKKSKSTVYKISDFDLAYCDYKTKKLEMSDVVGSIEYMSPEIASNLLQENDQEIEMELDDFYTEKTDIWSFGVLLYHALTGERPFTNVESVCGEDCEDWHYGECCIDCEESVLESIVYFSVEFPERLWRGISSEAKDLVKRCLEKDWTKRISAEEILEHPFIKPSNKKKNKSLSKNNGMSGKIFSPMRKYQKSTSLPSMDTVRIMDSCYNLPNPFERFVPKAQF